MEGNVKFNIAIDGVPYFIRAVPCHYNSELQYKVSVNDNNDELLFIFDSEIGRYTAVGSGTEILPDNLELEIGNMLNGESLA